MGCFYTIILATLAILTMVTLLRWFEQVTEAVEAGWWNKVFVLVAMPFSVWFFPSRVSAGRPTPVPHHEPVRGFGSTGKSPKIATHPEPAPVQSLTASPPIERTDQPPPGTPKEFLGMPVIPPKKPRNKPAVDPEKLEKLRQKMREQGMLPPEE